MSISSTDDNSSVDEPSPAAAFFCKTCRFAEAIWLEVGLGGSSTDTEICASFATDPVSVPLGLKTPFIVLEIKVWATFPVASAFFPLGFLRRDGQSVDNKGILECWWAVCKDVKNQK